MMDIEQFRKAGYAAIDRICDYYANIESRTVTPQVDPGFLVKALPGCAPEKGENIDDITKDFEALILPGLTHWNHPSFFGYFPSTTTFAGILGDLYSTAVSNPGFNWLASPACTELEQVVMDWSATLFGLDEVFHIRSGRGGGSIQGSACESGLVAAIAARERLRAAHPDLSLDKLVLYVSSQTHSLGVKTAMLLGVKCRTLPVLAEDEYQLRGSTLKAAYEVDRGAGFWPFCLMATVGTTSSGTVDRLDEIGPLVKTFDHFWLHVDAAWAGVSYACPEFRKKGRLADVNAYADSFCTNFHKWGLVQFDASAFWVRERKHLTEALEITPSFLRTKQGDAGTVIDYRNWQVALGRRFRSIKIWFVLRSYGIEGFQAHIRKGVRLGIYFESLIRSSKLLELYTPRNLSLVVFRLSHAFLTRYPRPILGDISNGFGALSIVSTEKQLNDLNLELHKRITEGPDGIFITRTELNGHVALRMAMGNERALEKHVKQAFDVFEKRAAEVLRDSGYVLPSTTERANMVACYKASNSAPQSMYP
ncbi:hypothetical protein DL93DRAFT_2154308 [Clavulina sp. PMI_390]|nr:hypothetical protein DL93DRAFT_2154308 [Clavulina sp. PMI_390]